ncbi:MAG: LysM peptidoglycan-binding domain-containing M23 family metallopeptidase, partial [Spirochaetes bacterium]|nr:LysM peptidoglycan-binding domain-containing M23 family metallopeptidase [Spirochaetota bacterium]
QIASKEKDRKTQPLLQNMLINKNSEEVYYTVKQKDNLWKISKKFDIHVNDLVEANKIKDPNIIIPGQKLLIPEGKSSDLDLSSISLSQQNMNNTIPVRKNQKFKLTWPLKGRITSEFGVRRSPYNKKMEFHTGMDIASKLGKDFEAAERGKVVFSGIQGGYGKTILIRHKNGYSTFYAHALLSYVKTGQYVERGQVIGRVGNTGLSTGPHLHFEIRKNNIAIDPSTIINKRLLFY